VLHVSSPFRWPLLTAPGILVKQPGVLDAPCRFGPFSLRQLLRPTAGVPEYGALADYQDAVARNDPPRSEQELVRRVDAHQLLLDPTLSIAAFADVDAPGVVERAVLDLAA
jgi:hypothetical protein